jgi:putative addiction module component (TIGR02574 family)
MNTDLAKLIEAALRLPPEARGALASRLLESIHDDQADPDAEAAWEAEIARRLEELDSGKVKTIPWSEARQQILRAQ